MTRVEKDVSRKLDAAIATVIALAFSIAVALVGARVIAWIGPPIPKFTTFYLAYNPAWIAVNAGALALNGFVAAMQLESHEGRFWKAINSLATVLSVLTVLAGLVAFGAPALHVNVF